MHQLLETNKTLYWPHLQGMLKIRLNLAHGQKENQLLK
jgi:hypothetical protein